MSFSEVKNDAGLFREYLVKNYGGILMYGGLANSYFMARKLAKRLARLVGKKEQEIINDIIEDYQNL